MCKVAAVMRVTDKNRTEVWGFMQILGSFMTPGNDDGLGYAAFDNKGKLFGERWLNNSSAFQDLAFTKGLNAEKMNRAYSFFGDKVLRDEAQAIILHTRAATCGRGIANTHPFVNDIDNPTVATIHNGIIYNDLVFPKKYSTCDSEVLVHLYDTYDAQVSIKNINQFIPQLSGWFTVLNLLTDMSGRMVLDAYTDNGRLVSYFIPELETRVYSSNYSDIEDTATFMGMTYEKPIGLAAGKAIRMDILSGEIVERVNLKDEDIHITQDTDRKFIAGMRNVTEANGNFDDEDFAKGFFERYNRGRY